MGVIRFIIRDLEKIHIFTKMTILPFFQKLEFSRVLHMVPTMPPFFLPGRKIIPGRKKKKDKFDRHIIGNSRLSMLFNFNVNFVTFLKLH